MNRGWPFVGFLFAVHTICSLAPLGVPALIPFMQAELNLSLTALGALSAALSLGVAGTALFAGWWADIFGARILLGAGIALSGLAFIAAAASTTVSALTLCLVAAGIGYSALTPTTNKIVLDRVDRRIRATAMGIKQTGANAGGFLAALIFPAAALAYGWPAVMATAGAMIIVAAVIVVAVYRDNVRQPGEEPRQPLAMLKDILTSRDLFLVCADTFVRVGVQFCILTYLMLFARARLEVSLVTAGTFLAVCQLSGAGGRVLWGLTSDRLFAGRRKPVYLGLAVIAAGALICMSELGPGAPPMLLYPLFALLGLMALGFQALGLSLAAELVGARSAGAASGLSTSAAFLGVVVLSPICGLVIEQSGSYGLAWKGLAGLSLLAAALIVFVREPCLRPAGVT